MDYKFILLLARQRSGTSALSSIMQKHPEVCNPGEPFHIGHFDKPTNFFAYKERIVRDNPAIMRPDRNLDLLNSFIDWTNETLSGTTFLDVKYNQTHFLNGESYLPTQPPWLVKHALINKIPIIHLTRKNHLRTFISEARARKTGVWHSRTGGEVKDDSVHLNVEQLMSHIKSCDAAMHMFAGWMVQRPRVFTIDYSQLFKDSGHLSDMAINGINRITGLESLADLKSDFVKTAATDLHKAVSNYDKVAEVLGNSDYAWMLET